MVTTLAPTPAPDGIAWLELGFIALAVALLFAPAMRLRMALAIRRRFPKENHTDDEQKRNAERGAKDDKLVAHREALQQRYPGLLFGKLRDGGTK